MAKESLIKRITKNLQFRKPKRVNSTELGGTGTPIFSGIIDTEEYVSDLKGIKLIDTINQMRWSDASVNMALLAVTLPILSADWQIEPATEDKSDVEVAEFVEKCLFEKMNWEYVLRHILLMLPYGYSVLEKVFTMDEDGIIWKKWAPRLPKTIDKWNVEKGELKSILQKYYQDNNWHEIEIPKIKLLVFTNNKEGDNYTGTSILRQAYKHWFFRDKYYKIDAIATERHGVGIPVITLPEGYTEQDKEEAEEMGKNLRANEQAYIVRPSDKWLIEMLDMKSSTIKDPKEMLDHHTREILKSVLAQFIELGSTNVGSYALSKDQSSFFLNAMDTIANNIESVINQDAIKQLVDLNFTVKEYPKLNHGDLGTVNVEELANSIQALAFAGGITPDMEMEEYLRNVLKLPPIPDELKEIRQEGEMAKAEYMAKNPVPTPNGTNPEDEVKENDGAKKDKEKKEEKKMSERKWHRDLTPAENRVRFDEIDAQMTTEESKLYRELSKILLKERAYLLPLFERAVQNKDLASLNRIAGKFTGEYERVFRNGIKKIFEYGKNKASFEIKKTIPTTIPEEEEKLYDKSHYYANKGYSDLVDALKSTASLAILNEGISETEAVYKIKNAFKGFLSKNVKMASNLAISENLNAGRKYVFDKYEDDLYAYQWSAILDGGTCSYCQSMDGKTISSSDSKTFNSYQPGRVHFNCRCIWVAVLKDDTPLPAFTGIPEALKPQTEVPPWDFQDLAVPLPGSSSTDIDERLYGVRK
jgi:hypothetical protein